jgi:type VI secretion system protein ImpL
MTAAMQSLPAWLAVLVPPVLTAVLAVLLVVTTVAAILQLRAASPAPPPPRAPTNTAPGGPSLATRAIQWISAVAGAIGTRLGAARAVQTTLSDTPLLIAIGASTGEVLGMIQGVTPGPRGAAPGVPGLTTGDALLSFGPDGAIVTFPDGLLGSDGWQARWTAVIAELASRRRPRPLDALVIVLGADYLSGATKLDYDTLVALGGALHQAIAIAQQAGGWNLPIQLILNRCEVLGGFASTAAALPSELRQGPFGWAPPAGLGPGFGPGWVDSSINALTQQVAAMQARLLPPPDGAAAFRQLPASLAALAQPLSTLLNHMLGAGVDHPAPMFRGFYLTGRAPLPGAGSTAGDQDVFAQLLFPDRLFPEHTLAQPTTATVTRRGRQIRILQVAVCLLVLLALSSLVALSNRQPAVATVDGMIAQVGATLQQWQAGAPPSPGTNAVTTPAPAPTTTAPTTTAPGIPASDALLRQMTPLALDRLETAWAPLSFLTDASAGPEAVVRSGYETILFPAVYARLTGAIPGLLGIPPWPANPAATEPCTAGTATSADTDQLQPFGDRLGQYGQQIQAYQDLPLHPDIPRFGSLLTFALGLSPPSGFASEYRLYQAALRRAAAPQLDTRAIHTTLDDAVRAQFARGLAGAYPGSPVARAVDTVAATAGLIEGKISAAQALRQLDAALHTLQTQATLLGYPWLADNVGDTRIIAFLHHLGTLSPSPVDADLATALGTAATTCRTQTRDRLLATKVLNDVAVLTTNPVQVALSPALVPVLQAVDRFLAQPLMTATLPAAATPPPPPNGPLMWDQQALQSVQSDAAAYLLFVAQDLPATLPASLVAQIQAAAGAQLDALTNATVAQARQRGAGQSAAAQPSSTALLHDEITRFADAAPVLTNLRASLRQAGRTTAAAQLDGIVFNQAIALLRQVDTILNGADPYQLADPTLAFWSGSPPLAAPAFGAESLAELVASLPARRNYVAALSQDYAAPLVAYMQQSGALPTVSSTALLSQWQLIASTLDHYQSGDATNSLSHLEQFISTTMDQITPANCTQLTSGGTAGSDWFAEQLRNIQTAVSRRCGGVVSSDTSSRYGDLAGDFNRDLAGRFPFGDVTAPDAYAGDIKRFYSTYGADLAALRPRVAGIPSYARAGVPQFVDQLQAVQTALAPLLANPAPGAALTYDVAPQFRTNAGSDPGADQVIEADLQLGAQTLSSFATGKSLTWTNGQPVAMQLHWAQNAPNVPVAGKPGQPPTVNGLEADYKYGGAWALLRLIAAQRPDAATLAQLSDRRPETIEFSLGLAHNPNAASGGDLDLKSAQLFMRLPLTAIIQVPQQPDKRQPVSLPVFPQAAPVPGAP